MYYNSTAVPRVSTSAAYKQSKDNKLMNVLSPMASSGSSGISSADPMCNLHGKLSFPSIMH